MLHKIFDPAVIKFRAHQAGVRRFEPKLKISIDHEKYLIKTAETDAEFNEVLRLRYDVFLREGLNKKIPLRVDVDRFDFLADHLLIIEKSSQRVVGTYRLICSLFSEEFYSQSEFEMSSLLRLPGVKLELGRACTAQDFRSGIAIALLWRGLARYVVETKAKYLFGCASVKTVDPLLIAEMTKYFEQKGNLEILPGVHPRGRYEIKNFSTLLDFPPAEETGKNLREQIPSLLLSYFKMGAKICSWPALDRPFKCADFLTVLKTDELTAAFEKRYEVC